jgi:ribonuclease P/MRP protein subunit RPP40
MERVIYADIVAYLRQHNAISKQQHAFLSRRSTCTNLIETINDWTLAIKNKKTVAVAYIDYSRAFDTVSHKKLLTKLQAYGIRGNLLAWIESFLTGRSQQTRVGDTLSHAVYLRSGVVQGSVLGPLLFLLYINDVVEVFRDSKCTCKLYADDLKIYTEIQLVDDLNLLQSALDALYEWSDRWQLSISCKKCSAILINVLEQSEGILNAYPLSVGPNCIATNCEIKDLGITIDSKLGFSSYISNIVARAHARSNLIYKCFISKDTTTLLRAYTTYVRPLLEYATCIWSPQHVTAVRQVESVQRRFTKRLPGLKHLSYESRLAVLGIEKLELRRLKQDLITAYKILFGLLDVNANELFTVHNTNYDTRGHAYKLLQGHCRTDVRRHFFTERVIKIWNNLPANETDFYNVKAFSNFLNKLDLHNYLYM